jgi:hypothetical protein
MLAFGPVLSKEIHCEEGELARMWAVYPRIG